MLHVVLIEPEIPHNAGAAGRLALATGARLHLVKPLGFSLDDKQVRRSGLDYWNDVDLAVWDRFDDLLSAADEAARWWFLTTKASRAHWDAEFRDGDYLVFGCESRGLPEAMIREADDQALRIPMKDGGTRSLNLSTAVGIVLYEAVRQVGL
jgi:tRNA (cytidine/uridine-2'-O-)-methyltransferase